MTAIWPCCSRLVRFLVRASTRATPETPEPTGSRGCRRSMGGTRIAPILPRRPGSAPPVRGGEQLLGVRPRGPRVLLTGQHPGQLLHPTGGIERGHVALGHAAVLG